MSPWPLVAIGEIAEVAAGGGAPQQADAFSEIGTPFIRAGSLTALISGPSESALERIESDTARNYRLRTFPTDTVVFAKSGMSATKGYIHRLRGPAHVVNHLCALIAGPRLDPSFLQFALKEFSPTTLVQDAAYPSIRLSDVGDFQIPLPPLPEQRRIAGILDQAEALRTQRRAALAKLDTLAQSVFIEMFGDPVLNPMGWPSAKLGNLILSASDGPHVSPNYVDAGVPFLSTRHVRPGEVTWEDLKYISQVDAETQWRKCRPRRGDILYTKGGTTGLAATVLTDDPFAVWVHVALLKPDYKVVDSLWLESALNTTACYRQSQEFTHGIANRDLGLKRMINIKMFRPPLEAQRDFSRRRQALEKQRTSLRRSLTSFDALFKSLQHRAFRGEL